MSVVRLLGWLIAANVCVAAAGHWLAPAPKKATGSGIRVGLVFDIGGKNDKSFNEAAWRGVEKAQSTLGIVVRMIEPSDGADRESALRQLAAGGFDLVIAVGFIFGPDLERIAGQFPAVRFAGVDYSPSPGFEVPGNLVGLRFREHEGSFVVGAIAAAVSGRKTVGFVGGMEIPLIRKFEAGYTAGVRHVCPECRVLAAYAGTEPKAFSDPNLGQELAMAQYRAGADIVFHAAGKTGDGVIAAARSRGARAIGVDSDQFDLAPCCVVTSMLKRVDVAVLDVIERVTRGEFRSGLVELGLADGGVGFVSDDRNQALLPPDAVALARKVIDDIIAGRVEVPDR